MIGLAPKVYVPYLFIYQKDIYSFFLAGVKHINGQ